MDDKEKEEFLRQIHFLQEKINQKDIKKKTPEEIIQDIKMYGDTPQNVVAHQHKLLFHVQKPPSSQMDLLGLVKDSKTLFLLQKDNELLNRFYDLGTRNDGVMELFDSLFYSWWQQLRMTGTLGATERWLQSFLEPVGVPYEGFTFLEKRQAKKIAKNQNLLTQLKNLSGGEKTYE